MSSITPPTQNNAWYLLQDLSLSPAGELKLKSNGGLCTVELQFSPRQHLPPFTAKLQADFAGFLHPLLTIQGSCQVNRDVHVLSTFFNFIYIKPISDSDC